MAGRRVEPGLVSAGLTRLAALRVAAPSVGDPRSRVSLSCDRLDGLIHAELVQRPPRAMLRKVRKITRRRYLAGPRIVTPLDSGQVPPVDLTLVIDPFASSN